eukprot:TRINITY_DN2356_c0_g1_i1.p3 TRINITY_DN2356_c0_g1~~TRINITY_DN2356_c0_g1_i1.p3  ORF type:complete len:201 (+),score=42.38 TRINITY_DN2356_c0_g1_i1:282-884(+)
MLYYSGAIHSIGEVHDGDTTMDHMVQEQERGITITSAAIYFDWKGYRFNLIDTPGHVDFTIEVERSISVLDGAVTVLDAVAGVQAQTETVWRQAQRYSVPKIVYVNKMDRQGADFARTVQSIQERFKTPTLCIHQPVLNSQQEYVGSIDVIRLEKIENSGERGEIENRSAIEPSDSKLYDVAIAGRQSLAEEIASTYIDV